MDMPLHLQPCDHHHHHHQLCLTVSSTGSLWRSSCSSRVLLSTRRALNPAICRPPNWPRSQHAFRLRPCFATTSNDGGVESDDGRVGVPDGNSSSDFGTILLEPLPPSEDKRNASDLQTLLRRFWKVAAPYWSSEDKSQARLRLAGVFALTLATTGISVGFNFLGRDFYNALSSKNEEQFTKQLLYYLGAFIGGIPVFVLRDYGRDTLALRWRAWMTSYYMDQYFENRTFYQIQSQSLIDNPDQRIVDDLNSFTATSLSFALALFNAIIDLVSFSGILFGIYPPLFLVLLVYSIGGTAISIAVGKGLVNLNFLQEKKEADFRYGLVRVRENAESIAFYGGENNEFQLLLQRFKQSFDNYTQVLIASRNLEFFTSGYRYLIQILPAAVVAPMFFSGKIEFGVINQSYSAFNHILGDFSIIVYQFQALSAFSAVIDRLGEFRDTLDNLNASTPLAEVPNSASNGADKSQESWIRIVDFYNASEGGVMSNGNQPSKISLLLEVENLTLRAPQSTVALLENLSFSVCEGENLLITGASGSGKTSLLRAIAGLWKSGRGTIRRYVGLKGPIVYNSNGNTNGSSFSEEITSAVSSSVEHNEQSLKDDMEGKAPSVHGGVEKSIFFLPQRPYMILGTLRQQLLYPTWTEFAGVDMESNPMFVSKRSGFISTKSIPSDEDLVHVLKTVRLGHLMARCNGLDSKVEWASVLSLGEQQRLAFARLLLSAPKLALLDESTSALDEENEAHLYQAIKQAGVTYISVGHRRSLPQFHSHALLISETRKNESDPHWVFKLLNQPDASTLR